MSSNQPDSFRPDDAEGLLASLAGVISAHIVADAAGRPVEIHVLAEPDIHPKQVVRNVESALSAGLGIEVDRRIVSVAQVRHGAGGEAAGEEADGADPADAQTASGTAGSAGDPDPSPAAGSPEDGNGAVPFLSISPGGRSDAAARSRPGESTDAGNPQRPEPGQSSRAEFVRFEAGRESGECACTVVLKLGDRQEQGTARGPDTPKGRALAGARATFAALTGIRPTLEIALHGVAISESAGRSFVIVSAHVVSDRRLVPLSGAALVTGSPEEAGILAALQASNRRSG